MVVDDDHYLVPHGVWQLVTETPGSENRGRGVGVTSDLGVLGQAGGQLTLQKIQR